MAYAGASGLFTSAYSDDVLQTCMGKLTIGFVGAGKMATALARGFVRAGLVSAKDIIASDVLSGAREIFQKEVGAKPVESNLEVVEFASVLVLAVKPDQ